MKSVFQRKEKFSEETYGELINESCFIWLESFKHFKALLFLEKKDKDVEVRECLPRLMHFPDGRRIYAIFELQHEGGDAFRTVGMST